MECKKCQLYCNSKHPCLQGIGNKQATLFIIGMNPGENEDIKKIPFIGDAGQELNKVLIKLGIKRDEIYITNITKCRTPFNREPTKEETKACMPYLLEEIDKVKPNVILILGNYACQSLLGKTGITKLRGKPIWNEKFNATIIPTFHPSYIIRRKDDKKAKEFFIKDIEFAYNSSKSKQIIKTKKPTQYVVCNTLPKALSLLRRLNQVKEFAMDFETSSLNPKDKLLCASFSWKEATAVILPFYEYERGDYWSQADLETIKNKLADVLANGKIKKIFCNYKYDYKWIKFNLNMHIEGTIFDVMIAHYLIDVTNRKHGLKEIAYTYTDMGGYDDAVSKDRENGFRNTPPEEMYQYAGADADCTYRSKLALQIEIQPYMHLMTDIMLPLSEVLAEIEYHGVKINRVRVKKLIEETKPKLDELENEMSNFPGVKKYVEDTHQEKIKKARIKYLNSKTLRRRYSLNTYLDKIEKVKINFRSPLQLRKVLYNYLNLEPFARTKKTDSYSTDETTLKLLQGKHKIIDLLLKYRALFKFYSTYLLPMLEKPDENDRLHTEYRSTRTFTGRLSSKNINLQNIPKKPFEDSKGNIIELGKLVRQCFIADTNNVLVESDLKQIEFRILAHYANDPQMLEDIRKDDPHRLVAAQTYKKKPEEITKEERDKAKTITFGIPYGRGAKAIAKAFNMAVEEAEKLMKGFFQRYPKALIWINAVKKGAKKYKYVKTYFGRKRNLPDIDSEEDHIRTKNEREAIATVIQGSASDILSIYTIKIARRLKEERFKSKIVLTIHDSLVLDVPKKELTAIASLLKEEMTKPIEGLRVPIETEICVGDSWGNIKEQKIDDIEQMREEE